MKLAFFTNPWGSGEIRGRQIAERLGSRVDPEVMADDEFGIYIKDIPRDFRDQLNAGKAIYVDIVDGYGLIPYLRHIPEIKVIVLSSVGMAYLSGILRNELIFIPEHHCNFDNRVREDRPVRRVGYVGYPESLHLDLEQLFHGLAERGLELVVKTEFSCREEIVEFYQQVDLQITFRRHKGEATTGNLRQIGESTLLAESTLTGPLKLINAGSFGIPTVGFPEYTYVDEFDDCFVPVFNVSDMVDACHRLAIDEVAYRRWSERALERSSYYHIDQILPLYQRLAS